jgi:hypothetical protein
MRPKLLQQYKAQQFDASWLPYLMNDYRTYNLSTEFVVREAMICTPMQGRIYRTDLWVVNKQKGQSPFVTTHERLHAAATKNPKWGTFDEQGHGFGVWNFGEEVYMVEHYEDHGDDGHTDMQLTGYIFVPASGLELIDRYGRKQFAYIEILHDKQMAAFRAEISATPLTEWRCDLCGRGAADCNGEHFGEGFQ